MKPHLSVLLSAAVGFCVLAPGCASQREQNTSKPPKEADRLVAGDPVRINLRGTGLSLAPMEYSMKYSLDENGRIKLLFNVSFELAGLTPDEAASRIRDAYVPRFFRTL